MRGLRLGVLAVALGAGLAGLPAGDAATVTLAPGTSAPALWQEVAWPFPLDQWGTGRAFVCRAADCGAELNLYLRAKLGFCNCATGVADDEELDRVGDLELFSDKFQGLAQGRAIAVGWMKGRSRPYRVETRYQGTRHLLAIAFNDKCDVVVATVAAPADGLAAAEGAALDFLNSERVLRWAAAELGV